MSIPAEPKKVPLSDKKKAVERPPVISKRAAQDKKSLPVQQRPAAADRKSAVSSDGRSYSVQVGAFSSLSDARTHRIRFSKKGYKASVYKDRGAGGADIFKVRVGIYSSRADAEKMARRIKSAEGTNGFVTAIE
jgi:DedD protein